MSNPIKSMYIAFWQMLEDSSDFTTLVPVGNRIKFYAGSNPWGPEKDEISAADVPEVKVVWQGAEWQAFSDSSNSGVAHKFAIKISTGEYDAE